MSRLPNTRTERTQSLARQVYDVLHQKILTFKHKPYQQLSESSVSEMLNVSRFEDSRGFFEASDYLSFGIRCHSICPRTVDSPQSIGLAEAFVKTLKRDYVQVSPLMDAESAFQLIEGWIEDYNENRPHSGLKWNSPREFIRARNLAA